VCVSVCALVRTCIKEKDKRERECVCVYVCLIGVANSIFCKGSQNFEDGHFLGPSRKRGGCAKMRVRVCECVCVCVCECVSLSLSVCVSVCMKLCFKIHFWERNVREIILCSIELYSFRCCACCCYGCCCC